MNNETNGLRCPRCNSKHNYIRIKTQELMCQNCSNVSTEKEWKKYNEICH